MATGTFAPAARRDAARRVVAAAHRAACRRPTRGSATAHAADHGRASDFGLAIRALGVGKSVVIDLPRDIKDVLVARSEDRQCGGALDAPRLPDRRRGRPDQHLLLRRRRQADRRLRHRGDARPQRHPRGAQAGAARGRHPHRGRRRRRHAVGHRRERRPKRSRPTTSPSRLRRHDADKVVNSLTIRGRDQIMLKVTVAEVAARHHQAARHRSQRQPRLRQRGAQFQHYQPVLGASASR